MDEESKKEKRVVDTQIIQSIEKIDTSSLRVSDEYVRKNYADLKKMKAKKEETYRNTQGSNEKTIIDPNTGKVLHRNQGAAVNKYGKKSSREHISQTDHTVPLKDIYDRHSDSAWLTDTDIKKAANNKHNLKEISARTNQKKQDKTNL